MSKQGPEDAAGMADDFPSPEPTNRDIDIQSEYASQVAAEAVAAAAAVTAHSIEASASQRLPLPGQGPPVPSFKRNRPSTNTSSASNANLNSIQHQSQPTSLQYHIPNNNVNTPVRNPDTPLSNAEQLQILRNFYMQNPTPSRREMEQLAKETGRHWVKIREYFRQRRNKLRGVGELESLDEPGRAMGWLQVTYKTAPPTSQISQLSLYNNYKTRFDPYATHTPLLGGQELIQLACATFSGCEMAKDEGDYVLKGLKEKEGGGESSEGWEKGIEGLVEPLRAGSWLLNTFQNQTDPSGSNVTQTDLYTSYATRFSTLLPDTDVDQGTSTNLTEQQTTELQEFEDNMASVRGEDGDNDLGMKFDMSNNLHESLHGLQADDVGGSGSHLGGTNGLGSNGAGAIPKKENRLLNPVELISLARMTFPKCEPTVEGGGRFVIKGIERREGVEKIRGANKGDMFPFALATAPNPSDSNHPFTSLLKRKLALLTPDESPYTPKKMKSQSQPHDNPATDEMMNIDTVSMGLNMGLGMGLGSSGVGVGVGGGGGGAGLTEEDKELIDGLKRFRGSSLGREVRDVCVNQ